MANVLRIKNEKGDWVNVPAIKGDDYILTEEDKQEIADMTSEMVGDEWITIADITTTEEVNSIFLTKDVDGNAFKCKRFVAKLKFPQSWTKVSAIYVGVGGDNTYSPPYTSFNTNGTIYGVDVYIELIKNKCIVFEIHMVGKSETFIDNLVKGKIVRTVEKESLESFRIAWGDASLFIPTGSTLKVWGLKQ